MDELPTLNSSGKISSNKYIKGILTFLSPRIFWPVYGYWISLLCMMIFHAQGVLDTIFGLPDWLFSLKPEIVGRVAFEPFIVTSLFFIMLLGLAFYNIGKGRPKIWGSIFLHVILIVLFTKDVSEFVLLFLIYKVL
ncbi:MAG: hypothetical protein OEY94_06595 [Alphaproteobacteria bacterium]|nr:hypothetical protein [Alphaproteobacteria bacterium]